MRLRSAVVVLAIGCSSQSSKPGKAIDPNSGYAKLRPRIVKAVAEFPADPTTLARCEPGLADVVMLTLDDAARLLKIPLEKQPAAFKSVRFTTFFAGHMDRLERLDFESYNLTWFERANRFGLFSAAPPAEPYISDAPGGPQP